MLYQSENGVCGVDLLEIKMKISIETTRTGQTESSPEYTIDQITDWRLLQVVHRPIAASSRKKCKVLDLVKLRVSVCEQIPWKKIAEESIKLCHVLGRSRA